MAPRHQPARFTYWSGSDQSAIAPMTTEWQAAFPDFTIIGDDEIQPLLEDRHPKLAPLYRRLNIPAARSDIARLAWLEAHGGFYVDAHAGLRDATMLHGLFDTLPDDGVALINKNPKVRPAGSSKDALWPLNGAIFARREAPFLTTALAGATDRLTAYDHAPGTAGIWEISGPGLFITLLRDPARPTQMRPQWQPKVRMLEAAEAPVRFYVHKSYRDRARHWSALEQQQTIFDPPDER